MALFYLLTIYASVRAHTAPRAGPWLAVAVAASTLGILSKQSMVTIPLAVLLVDYALFFDSLRSALRSRWRFYVAVTAASLPVGIVMALVSPSSNAVGFSSGPSPWVYLLNQSVIITHYLTLTIWPHALVCGLRRPRSVRADRCPAADGVHRRALRPLGRRPAVSADAWSARPVGLPHAGGHVERGAHRDGSRRGAPDVPAAGGAGGAWRGPRRASCRGSSRATGAVPARRGRGVRRAVGRHRHRPRRPHGHAQSRLFVAAAARPGDLRALAHGLLAPRAGRSNCCSSAAAQRRSRTCARRFPRTRARTSPSAGCSSRTGTFVRHASSWRRSSGCGRCASKPWRPGP